MEQRKRRTWPLWLLGIALAVGWLWLGVKSSDDIAAKTAECEARGGRLVKGAVAMHDCVAKLPPSAR